MSNDQYERREMTKKEKNSKQILIDWVKNVQKAADQVSIDLNDCHYYRAKAYVNYIRGKCNVMMTVLKNSD